MVMVVRQRVSTCGGAVEGAGGDGVVDVPVDECSLCGLFAHVEPGQVLDSGISAVAVDDRQHLVGVLAFQEHDAHPPRHRPRCCRGGIPGDPPRGSHCRIHPVVYPVQQRRGLLQLSGRGESVGRTGGLIPGVVVRAHPVLEVGGGELVEHLPEGAHPSKQITEHGIGVGGVLEHPGGVCEPTERFGRFGGVHGRVLESRHDGLLSFRRCGTAATLRQ